MKNKVLKAVVAMGVAAVISACGDDPAGPNSGTNSSASGDSGSTLPDVGSSDSAQDDICTGITVASPAWVFKTDAAYVIYPDGIVTDAAGTNIAYFLDGVLMDLNGAPIASGIDLAVLPICSPKPVIESGSSSAVVPGSSAALPGSSADVNPTSSADVNPGSSADVVPESSSSNPELDANGFPAIESYGPPPEAYTKDILSNGQTGWNSRYWDACKPHCSWISNGEEGKTDTTTQESYEAGMTTARNCNIHDVEVPTFTLGHAVQQYWMGYEGTDNACGSAKEKGVFTCTDMAPIQVSENLSYAYVAGPGSQTTCGKCFHLQYNGSFKDASANNAPKATHKALKGKHMVVMTSNIGHDVERGQFDLMVPGGGVGAFDALSVQVNGQGINWGAGFGGFLTECQGKLGYDNTLEKYQTCVKEMCDAAFGNAGLPNLLRGCYWFADWFMAADNPTYNWEEVECPQYLIDHYMTRINTTKSNNYAWHTDWSTYKEGDELETLECTDKGCTCTEEMAAKGACKL